MPTPDSFSRAARGAQSITRIVRGVAQAWRRFVDADGSAAAAVAAAAIAADRRQTPAGGGTGGAAGRTQEEGSEREVFMTAEEVVSWAGGVTVRMSRPDAESPAVEAVALQLVEIFPDMGRPVALRRARAARGSVERAVELALAEPARGEAMMSAGEGGAEEQGADQSGARDAARGGGMFRRRWRGL